MAQFREAPQHIVGGIVAALPVGEEIAIPEVLDGSLSKNQAELLS